MFWLKNLDTADEYPYYSKADLLDAIPPTIPAGPQACRWLCTLDGSLIEAAYFKAKVAGVWKLYTAECAACIRIYQPNVAAIQTWVGERLPEGVNVDYEFDPKSANFQDTPGASDTSSVYVGGTDFTLSGGNEYYLNTLNIKRALGTINYVIIIDTGTSEPYYIEHFAAGTATVNIQFASPRKLPAAITLEVGHSATASGVLDIAFNYKFK